MSECPHWQMDEEGPEWCGLMVSSCTCGGVEKRCEVPEGSRDPEATDEVEG